jgi:hypothetical protein
MANSDTIELTSPSKQFQYSNVMKRISNIDDVDQLKQMLLVYVKLYMRHEELVSDLHSQLRKI